MTDLEFIPGMWEEEINTQDFIHINLERWQSDNFIVSEHTLKLPENYNVLLDEENRFKYLSSYKKEIFTPMKMRKRIFIDESTYTNYIETGDRKKLRETQLLVKANESERTSFFQPDISVIPLYGTRKLIQRLKDYIKEMDKQYQSISWIQRRISHQRGLEMLIRFEQFAKEHGVKVKKQVESADEAIKVLWIAALYAAIEDVDIPFSFYSIFGILDIYIGKDLKNKKIDEQIAQRMVDELYVKLASLSTLSEVDIPFGFNFTIGSEDICKTTYRFLESAKVFNEHQISIQLIFHSKGFPEDMLKRFNSLYAQNHQFAVSQSFRRKDDTSLTLTSSHIFFRNYEDVVIQLASFDVKKAFIIALNGGKDPVTNINFYPVTQRVHPTQIEFETVFEKLESFLKYYITLYSEYMNVYTYYYDQYHRLPFRQALTKEYPHYLITMPYHNVTPLLKILTAIFLNKYELKVSSKGYIEDVVPWTEGEEEFIAERLNRIINDETQKILFYKKGKYNIVFFSESPFFQEEDEFRLAKIPPVNFTRTSFSGFQSVSADKFLEFLHYFPNTTYTHVRLHKK